MFTPWKNLALLHAEALRQAGIGKDFWLAILPQALRLGWLLLQVAREGLT